MAKQQQPFGGAPRIGNAAPGEPLDSPSTDTVRTHANDFSTGLIHRGSKAVNPDPSSTVVPEAYGGGSTMFPRPTQKPASGSGDGTGVGATSGSSQHSGAGIP